MISSLDAFILEEQAKTFERADNDQEEDLHFTTNLTCRKVGYYLKKCAAFQDERFKFSIGKTVKHPHITSVP